MKVIGIIGIAFLIIISCSIYIISRESHSEQKEAAEESEERACCSNMASGGISDNSLYLLESEWKNENGQEMNISELQNKNVVLGMIFANCSYACPIIVNDMKKVESKLSKNELEQTRFVLVSIDPDRDTPEKLKEFANKMDLDLSRWELLAGSKSDIRAMAAMLGFKYKRDDNGNYSHSNMISLLDKKGEIVYQHEGLNEDISDIANEIKDLN